MSRPSRREVLKKAGIAAGIAWTAPVLFSFETPAGASAGSGSPTTTTTTTISTGCTGGTCGHLAGCSPNADCVCVQGSVLSGICLPGSLDCAALDLCNPDLSCPPGSECVVDSCCGDPVCVPLSFADQCPPGSSPRGASSSRARTGKKTLASVG